MVYGYARCSTNESKQDINRQLRELKEEGAEEAEIRFISMLGFWKGKKVGGSVLLFVWSLKLIQP